MKRHFFILTALLLLVSCSGFDNSQDNDGGARELSLRDTVSGTISTTGEVDWYHYRTVEANNLLQVSCTSNTYRPDIQLLATVYEEDENGNKVRLYADHAPENSQLPADIKMNVYIDAPKDLYIAVRDLMDDGASDNPYYLSIDFADGVEENENFSQATPIIVDDASSCRADDIGYVGDVDCFSFSVVEAGVHAVQIEFSPFAGGTDVELSIDLYDNDGVLVTSLDRNQSHHYDLLPYLMPGDYFILIDDYGKNDFDPASPYTVCVRSVNTDEAALNDDMANASDMAYDPITRTFFVEGSLDYLEDQDWYRLPLNDISTIGFKVLQVTFDDGNQNSDFNYQLDLSDSEGSTMLSHRFTGGSVAYVSQIKAGNGDHFILIQASDGQNITTEAPYSVSVEVLDIDDPAETVAKIHPDTGETILGNNTIITADVLTPTPDPAQSTIGKIGFRGDEDWYEISINDPTSPHILEVYLDTDSEPSMVEYYVSIMRDQVIEKMYDTNGQDGGTELKTGIFVPATSSPTPLTYYFRVCDYQGDDGDGNVTYRLRANILDIPDGLPTDSMIPVSERVYYSEINERESAFNSPIRLELNSLIQKTYAADTLLLDFNADEPVDGINRIQNPDQTTTIVFPWIAGYIDYQGDQDWFQLNLAPLVQEGLPPDSQWYYDISVDLHVDNPGADVEYVWKLYRDYNNNQILVDRRLDSDGFFASAGDEDIVLQPINLSVPEAGTDQEFWVGDAWEGNFYLSISDFNYIDSPHPDDDWGYDTVPYYLRITLTYHPGVSYP